MDELDAPRTAVDAVPATVIVAVADRDIRRAWSQSLLRAGFLVRAATRPAEVAKAQADGTACLILRRDQADDALLTAAACIPTLSLAASHPLAELPTRLHKALAEGER